MDVSIEEDLIISQKDYPEAKKGDIIEIYHPLHDDENQRLNKINENDEEHPRLLLQIKQFRDDSLQTRTNYFI